MIQNDVNVIGSKIAEFLYSRPHDITYTFSEVSSILFELEFYKKKAEAEPRHKLCRCYKIIYQHCLSLFGFIITAKAINKPITLSCITESIPHIKDVDIRAAVLAYIFVRPLIKLAIKEDYCSLKNNIWKYVKETKLTLGGIHLDCENLNICHEVGKCKHFVECGNRCVFHSNKHATEYIRIYATDPMLKTRNRLKHILYWVGKFHKNTDNIWIIGDYKNLDSKYVWNEDSYKRFLAIKEFSNGKVKLINYEDNVDFGKYYNEVKDYLAKEDDIWFLNEEIC